MSFLDALIHLFNFFAPAIGVAIVAAATVKLLWRKTLSRVPFARLVAWSMPACAVCLVAGIIVVGRDGHMGTYAVMVAANAIALWWVGFVQGRGKG